MAEATRHTHNTSRLPTVHPIVMKLLEKRGWSGEGIQEFLSWDLRKLPELTAMHDLPKASERLIEALDKSEKIGIYGDYDVDGTTSCALLYHFFQMLEVRVELIQPSRFVEGYGIHPSSIDKAQEMGIQVLVTVDCGITNNEAAEYAQMRGLDLIITDHHTDARDEMPPAYAVVNPNRRDEPADSPLRKLAGVGVGFALALQIKQDLEKRGRSMPSLYPLLQFVAIGTICDLAGLNTMNIKLVRHGLKQLPKSDYPGIRQFLSPEERRMEITPSEKCSFNIGPMINSKGRLDHPERALQLLIADDSSDAFEHYAHLEVSNRERKFIQADVFKEAKDQVIKSIRDGNYLISIVYDSNWHEGVIGIVASKLVENFKVPAIVFTDSEKEGIIKASARSAGDLSIFNLLKECDDLFTKFGGHKAAAGLSMPKENLEVFISRMNQMLLDIPEIERTVQDSYDLEIAALDITPKLVKDLEMLEPFGMGNAKPVFKMSGFRLSSYKLMKDVHVRWHIESPTGQLGGVSFNYVGKWGEPHPEEIFEAGRSGESLSAYFTLGVNRFNGNEYIQLMIDRITID